MATQQLSLLERRLVAWGALANACGSRGEFCDFFWVERCFCGEKFGGANLAESLKLPLTAGAP